VPAKQLGHLFYVISPGSESLYDDGFTRRRQELSVQARKSAFPPHLKVNREMRPACKGRNTLSLAGGRTISAAFR